MSEEKSVSADTLIAILEKLFVVPDDHEECLRIAGLTDRQAKAILLYADGMSVAKIAKVIANGSTFTQNAYDALGVAVSKIFEALILVKVLTENKDIISEVLERGLNYKRRLNLEYK